MFICSYDGADSWDGRWIYFIWQWNMVCAMGGVLRQSKFRSTGHVPRSAVRHSSRKRLSYTILPWSCLWHALVHSIVLKMKSMIYIWLLYCRWAWSLERIGTFTSKIERIWNWMNDPGQFQISYDRDSAPDRLIRKGARKTSWSYKAVFSNLITLLRVLSHGGWLQVANQAWCNNLLLNLQMLCINRLWMFETSSFKVLAAVSQMYKVMDFKVLNIHDPLPCYKCS